jgi:prepilin-type N-terminal cleavage/methylation domain-containing protein
MWKSLKMVKLQRAPRNNKRGFTLIEMMVAISIFSIVAVIVTSSIIMMLDAARRANQTRLLMDNVDFALDSMVNKIKFGNDFPTNFTDSSAKTFTFKDRNGVATTYALSGSAPSTCIAISQSGGANSCITSSEINIDKLIFTDITDSAATGYEDFSPFRLIQIDIAGSAKFKTRNLTFVLRTVVSKQKSN